MRDRHGRFNPIGRIFMPWSNQSGGPWGGGGDKGGGDKGGSPWGGGGSGGGQGPGGNWGGNRGSGGGRQPPDLEEMFKRGQDRLKRVLPGGGGRGLSAIGIGILIAIGAVLWLLTGLYTVRQNEVAINLVFGKYAGKEGPGLKYNWPYPIGSVQRVEVTNINSMDIGSTSAGTQSNRNQVLPGDASLMLTGDERIVDIDFTVFWKVKDAAPEEFVFNLVDAPNTIKAIAQSVMREAVGRNELGRIVSGATSRSQVEQDVRNQMQQVLDSYKAGVTIDSVNLRTADVPQPVVDAFRDVAAAQQDSQRLQNEARTYESQVIPASRARSATITQSADGYRQSTVAEARGQASRFSQVYEEYRKAPDVTRERLFYETWERFFASTDKIIVDQAGSGGSGVVPYLPLPELQRRPAAAGAPAQPNAQPQQ
jgi:modulator of FtsH protease HflK